MINEWARGHLSERALIWAYRAGCLRFNCAPDPKLISRSRFPTVLTCSNCFKYAEGEFWAWINGFPLLNIAQITMPSENMSLKMLQLEFIWFSGAAKANNIPFVAHKLGAGCGDGVKLCGILRWAQIDTLWDDSQRDIARDNHFLLSLCHNKKAFWITWESASREHQIWSSHWTLWEILFDINKRRWGLFRFSGGEWS